jgi:hypothetical protein
MVAALREAVTSLQIEFVDVDWSDNDLEGCNTSSTFSLTRLMTTHTFGLISNAFERLATLVSVILVCANVFG